MAKTLKISLESPRSDLALQELLQIPGIEGRIEEPEPGQNTKDGGVLVTIAAIISITSGTLTIVDKIVTWWGMAKKNAETKQINAVIEDANGKRLLLDGATPEQIKAALETLSS